MSELPTARQDLILSWLNETPSLSIDELVSRLGVSIMTVHRDLDHLVRAGQVEKVHGGVMRAESRPRHTRALQLCRLCDAPISERTQVIIQPAQGEPLYACCPHCGLLLLADSIQPVSILAKDFIYGRMVNARTASFLVNSSVTLCCQPNYLCFACEQDARSFQMGFGGQLMTFEDARAAMVADHQHLSDSDCPH
jgi:DNA-binding transcriptional ArsR family regulator